ncbi:hypothetical protein T11_4688 [Trichinella zimbabwensis]|uniref:Uncharacterized protein n=1 Tax=Trichinella zimbabwensis TaxID=268475 RepID=A0A0V1HLI4_9BILA|nr:hypothetical protein T11_4688 [Trichinella zimbabwensis]
MKPNHNGHRGNGKSRLALTMCIKVRTNMNQKIMEEICCNDVHTQIINQFNLTKPDKCADKTRPLDGKLQTRRRVE